MRWKTRSGRPRRARTWAKKPEEEHERERLGRLGFPICQGDFHRERLHPARRQRRRAGGCVRDLRADHLVFVRHLQGLQGEYLFFIRWGWLFAGIFLFSSWSATSWQCRDLHALVLHRCIVGCCPRCSNSPRKKAASPGTSAGGAGVRRVVLRLKRVQAAGSEEACWPPRPRAHNTARSLADGGRHHRPGRDRARPQPLQPPGVHELCTSHDRRHQGAGFFW